MGIQPVRRCLPTHWGGMSSLRPPACLLRPWAITELLFHEPLHRTYIHLLRLYHAVLKHLREVISVTANSKLESRTLLPLQTPFLGGLNQLLDSLNAGHEGRYQAGSLGIDSWVQLGYGSCFLCSTLLERQYGVMVSVPHSATY